MKVHGETGRVLRAGIGMVVAAGLALLTGCAGEVGDPAVDNTPVGEASQAIDPIPPLPVGAYGVCTMSGPTSTGREWAALMPLRFPGAATRLRLGGEAPPDFPSCYMRARWLGLQIVE